jgi:integrase/recombinase XerC
LSEIHALTIRRYFAHLQDRKLSPFTISMHDKNLRALFNWLQREKLIPHNPMLDFGKPRIPKKIPKVLDEAQVQALLKACDRLSWHGFRDFALILVLLDCGLRISEAINLKLEDVNLATRTLKIHGKGSKDRFVYLGAISCKALRRWMEMRGFRLGLEHVFIDRKGESVKKRGLRQ